MSRPQMLRGMLESLRERGQLAVCDVPVDPKYELGAVLCHDNSEQPILFTNVKGSRVPVAGGLLGNRDILLQQLGVTAQSRFAQLMGAIAAPAAPRLVEQAPVQENVLTRGIDLLKQLPVPTSNSRDSGPFITAGILVYKDAETGRTHTAVRRFQVNRGNSINVLVSGASPNLLERLDRYAAQNRPFECAIILGYDVPFGLASQLSSGKYGLEEYRVDSALRGEPLELVRCRTIDLAVPAQAELVLEGVIRPGHKGPEGPFAELMGYYSEKGEAPLMDVTALTHRNDFIFQHAFPCREEHLIYGMVKEVELYAALKSVVDVRDVVLTVGGGCRLHVLVSIKKRYPGDGKSAILGVLGFHKDLKHVVVVDDDVNLYDDRDVEFAIASRFQASRDLVVVEGVLGSPLEASHLLRNVSDKMGLDATMPLDADPHIFERAVIPGFENGVDIKKYLPNR